MTDHSWVAAFRDGPLAGLDHERTFVVGPVWQRMVLVQLPRDPHQPMDPWPDHWAIVGGDGVPRDEDAEPWPGEVTYQLADQVVVSGALIAFYELAEVE